MDWRLLPNLVHGICSYHRTWLHGDERGFRSRDHRIHSSGDYKNPPPPSEHEGLRRYMRELCTGAPVFLCEEEYPIVGSAFAFKLRKMNCEVFIVACGCSHLHVLYQSRERDAQKELGKPKQYSSLKLSHPSGRVWAAGASIIRIKNPPHAEAAFKYINDHAVKEGAWIWRFDRNSSPTRDMIDSFKQETGCRV